MKRRIYFRADGNSEIGLGHVVRCLGLAEVLNSEYDITFITCNPSAIIRNEILNVCHNIIELSEDNLSDQARTVAQITQFGDVLILDGHNFGSEYQKTIKENSQAKLVSLDDLHDGHFYSDVIINHNSAVSPDSYVREAYTKLFVGFRYLLVRKEFQAQIPERRIISANKNLFICIGGADPSNLTLKILTLCIELSCFDKVTVVTGSAYTKTDLLLSFIKESKNVIHHSNVSAGKMVKLMLDSDLAIIPSSSVSLEAMCVGLNLITGYFVDNQKELSEYIHKERLGYSIGDFLSYDNNSLKKLIFDNKDISSYENQKRAIMENPAENLLTIFRDL
ncbi:MAG: UDP-2,4-diacetamido-2,4,6-trideoxy-beta-L-altropyranose hydrolase [Cytophagaceae bacterium]